MGLRKNFPRTQDLFGPSKKYFKRSKTFVNPQKNILKIHDPQKNIKKKSTTFVVTSQKKVLKNNNLKNLGLMSENLFRNARLMYTLRKIF